MTDTQEAPGEAQRNPTAMLSIIQTGQGQFSYALSFDSMHAEEAPAVPRILPCDMVAMALACCMMRPDSSYGAEITRVNMAVAELSEALDAAGDDLEAGRAALDEFARVTGLPINADVRG